MRYGPAERKAAQPLAGPGARAALPWGGRAGRPGRHPNEEARGGRRLRPRRASAVSGRRLPWDPGGWTARMWCGLFLLGFLAAAGCADGQPAPPPGPPEGGGLLGLARQAADNWIRTVRPEQNDWSWGDGELMFAMSNLAERTGDGRYWDYMASWMDHHLRAGYCVAYSDSCPPAIAAARLLGRTGDPRYREVLERVWHYLENVADRTRDGGLNHMGFISGSQLWVDSLFMFGIPMNEMFRLDGDPTYHLELVDQIRIFSNHLKDPGTGLFRHMYDDRTGAVLPESALFWARGNAWVFVTLVELLGTLPSEHAARGDLLSSLETLAASVAGFQDGSGLWHTLLNDPTTYLETSASALYAYGFHKGARLGLLPASYGETAALAMDGLHARLFRDCSGGLIVSGTSHGTSPGERDYYASVTTGDQVPYGVGAFVLAAVEAGDQGASHDLPARSPCPDHPVSPATYEQFRDRAVFRLGQADLEGAREDFLAMEGMDPGRGEGPFGAGLVDFAMAAFRVFDAVTRLSIEEIGWAGFQEVLRSDTLPELERIRERIAVAAGDPGFSLAIPSLQINRRGMYTPLTDLRFDPAGAGSVLGVLDLLRAVLRLVASLPG